MDKYEKSWVYFLAACAFALGLFHIVSNDVWWHLAAGRWMADNLAIPSADPFSYTTLGRKWVYHNWLFDLPLYLVEKFSGINGLIIFRAAIVTLLGLLIYRLMRRHTSPARAAVLTLFILGAIRTRFFLRPHLASFILFALLFTALIKLYEKERVELWSAEFVSVPVIVFLWANMHASAVFGIFMIGAFWVSGIIGRKNQKTFLILLCVSFAAGLLNPNLLDVYIYPFRYLLFKTFLPFANEEHLPPPGIMREPSLLIFWIITFAGAGLFLLRIKKAPPYLLILYFAFLCLALTSMRGIAFFSIVNGLAAACLWPGNAGKSGKEKTAAAILMLLAAATAFFTQSFEMKFETAKHAAPVSAADFAERVGLKGNMFNSHPYGGYLIHRFYPERKVFIDGRDLLHEKTMRMINDLGYLPVLNIFKVEWIIAGYRDGVLKGLPENDWQIIFSNDVSVVLAKKTGVNKNIVEKYGVDTSRHSTLPKK
ncbi:MAG: hypothetical protein IEMM0002_0785 [bacterium]|nr:MAG: hypothetical protein IEMM0002_0785 [bacterium]